MFSDGEWQSLARSIGIAVSPDERLVLFEFRFNRIGQAECGLITNRQAQSVPSCLADALYHLRCAVAYKTLCACEVSGDRLVVDVFADAQAVED